MLLAVRPWRQPPRQSNCRFQLAGYPPELLSRLRMGTTFGVAMFPSQPPRTRSCLHSGACASAACWSMSEANYVGASYETSLEHRAAHVNTTNQSAHAVRMPGTGRKANLVNVRFEHLAWGLSRCNGGPSRTRPCLAPADYATGDIAPLMMTEALLAASCSDLLERCEYRCVTVGFECPSICCTS